MTAAIECRGAVADTVAIWARTLGQHPRRLLERCGSQSLSAARLKVAALALEIINGRAASVE